VYTDGDIAFIDDIGHVSDVIDRDKQIKFDMLLFVFCLKGKMHIEYNGKSIDVAQKQVLCCGPNCILGDCMTTLDFEAKILCVSTRMMQRLVHYDKNILNHYFSMRDQPVIDMGEDTSRLSEHYYDLLKERFSIRKPRYNKEVIAALVSAGLYDFLGGLGEPESTLGTNSELITQGDLLYTRFLNLLSASSPRPRSVQWYASQLCVTPKYLSTVVKQATGKTALKWIADSVIEDIRRQLTGTSLSIKEISESMNFPNLSFFGKYVKQHLGCSPTEYRRRMVRR